MAQTMPPLPPPPLEWHPAYRDKTWLLDWLNGEGDYARDVIRLPVLRPMSAFMADPADPVGPAPRAMTMTRHKAAGPAPYVGAPFHYVWWVGVDEMGRCIASDSERWYAHDEAPVEDPALELAAGDVHPEPTSDEVAKASLTLEEAEVLQMYVQASGPIPDGRLAEVVEVIRRYLRGEDDVT